MENNAISLGELLSIVIERIARHGASRILE
jgi:hypothetical protein